MILNWFSKCVCASCASQITACQKKFHCICITKNKSRPFFRFTRVLEKKEMPNFKTFFWSLNRLKETTPFKVQHLWERFHWFQLIRWLSSATDVRMRSRPQAPWTKKKLQLSLQILFRPYAIWKKVENPSLKTFSSIDCYSLESRLWKVKAVQITHI